MKLYANLHSHTTHSDGVYTPAELVRVAKAEGYRAVAISDHDTVTGFAEAAAECERLKMETLFACEFSVTEGYHLVGMNFDPTYPKMHTYLEGMSYRESHQSRTLFERGVASGYLKNITWDEVRAYNKGITWLCNEHVFRTMKAKGLVTDLDYPDFFETVYGAHRNEVPPAYDFLPAKELIALVRAAGGIVIHAHPHGQLRDVPELVAAGLSGIEVFHQDMTREDRIVALHLAEQYDLFVSGGSDHEGLCGGQYARYPEPEKTRYYAPPCSLGTTEFFFRELKSSHKMDGRLGVIRALAQSLE